ncbi:MAG: hypothetical protein KJS77_02470 [Planctomycetes bacterium]|nr:hypothetical protein [Planctomycetota bacterium]
MNGSVWSIRSSWAAILAVVFVTASGCTSAISTAYLRDAVWDFADHAAEEGPKSAAADESATDETFESAEVSDTAAADAERREAAIEEAVSRLARIGALDEATRVTLIETLQRTQQEDWPVVVEAFASSLAEAAPPKTAAQDTTDVTDDAAAPVAASHTVAKADLDEAIVPQPAPVPPPPEDVVPPAAPPAVVSTAPPPAPEPDAQLPPVAAASAPSLAVRNACFATRVQAWGVLDRFAEARFRPGQEVIVYFELDNLSSGRSAAGHTTCIDTSLALVAADGTTVRDWSFEPIAETCASQRRDYFARYVIRLPEAAAAGAFRLDIDVVDTLAGTTSRASLPLEIGAESR